MACLPLPKLVPPSLTAGIGFGAATPASKFDAAICCKLVQFEIPPFPVKVPVAIPPQVMGAIRSGIQVIQSYIDKLQIDCPRE